MRVQILYIMEVNDHSLRVLGDKLETIRMAPRNHVMEFHRFGGYVLVIKPSRVLSSAYWKW